MMEIPALASKVQGTVLLPGTDEYENALKHWAANVERNATVVVQAASADDVTAAVPFISVLRR